MIVAAAIILGLFLLLVATASFWVDWWWFGSIGYRQVLTTRYLSQAVSFIVAGGLAALFFAVNWSLALRIGRSLAYRGRTGFFETRVGRWILVGLTAFLGLSVGSAAASRWDVWRLFLAGGPFGIDDPVFGRDAGFYVFQLPVFSLLQQGALSVLLPTLATVVAIYAVAVGLERIDLANPPRAIRTHVLALAAAFLLLIGVGYYLANFGLVYSNRGALFGVGYTDATVVRPLNLFLVAVSVVAAVVVLLNIARWRGRLLAFAGGAWLVAVVLGAILPALVQQTIVEPSELARERPYIANNIALTRAAYDLEEVESRNLSGQGEPSPEQLSPESAVFDNIRLWDYRIAGQTFQQLRSFVPYYVFPDVDVDRYTIDGALRQVLIAARELSTEGLPATAQTWVNQHFAYTHGYGVVVSPISEETAQGLPRFLVGNIPPEGTGPLSIERPEIYFGEASDQWVAVNSNQPEVSGLAGETDAREYDGAARGSVGVSSYLSRLVLALNLGDRRIMFGNPLTDESRILLRRTVEERVAAVAPFLLPDPDPLLVIANGRLVWVVDAYSSTDRFPGATPFGEGNAFGRLNYLRHTAKITVDAYDGTVTIYRTEVPDPIADGYARVFPGVFTPIAEAPPELQDHFRYPEGLFDIQSEVYSAYHVTDPAAFYNGEDRWAVAEAESDAGNRREGETRAMEAYYMTLPLPGQTEMGFKLVRPFTPNNRPNMTAWMAGQSDGTGLGRLAVYRFPRQTTVFGPQQVEARINQDPEISSQITLLNQAGSRVIRGNLLVIPIGESVIYVQPLYLQATETQGAPTELQFVIVATTDDVEMRPTLAEALAAVAGAEGAVQDAATAPVESGAAAIPIGNLVEQALAAYDRGEEALARGDWQGYGEAQSELAVILRRLVEIENGAPLPTDSGVPPVDGTPVPQ
jgi:uncharacterized membrane protein (UPF0182 family)